jgi:hypothetical protein
MTDDRMALQALLEKHGESDVIRKLPQGALASTGVDKHTGALK